MTTKTNETKKVATVATAYRGTIEIEKSEDGTRVTIRDAHNPAKSVDFPGGAVTDLIRVLEINGPYY